MTELDLLNQLIEIDKKVDANAKVIKEIAEEHVEMFKELEYIQSLRDLAFKQREERQLNS